MSRFTVGERRGLIVLMSILGVATIIMLISRGCSRDADGDAVPSSDVEVRVEAVADVQSADSVSVPDDSSHPKKRRSKKRVKASKSDSVTLRDPLSDELN
ncbi:MAG: hypothetical protein NC411_02350 [Bacteroides sp.]|nr:hypothetical protein [Bacteroides sp.]